MGDGADTATETVSGENGSASASPMETPEERERAEQASPSANDRRQEDDIAPETNGSASTTASEKNDRNVPGIPRTTVRITADVGEIVGADDRDYDLGSEDVVTLPSPNADVLVEKDAAERLD
jgi:DNA replication factor GINS